MIHHYDLALTDESDEDGFRPFMSACILGGEEGEDLRQALVICPGGGYESVCEYWEGERYAMAYAAAGLNAIMVNYTTCRGGRYPRQLKELARALEITREHAEEWHIDPNKIAACGSSAGGHLAASLSTLWNSDAVFTKEQIASRRHRPDATVLCYPVITSGDKAHKGSFRALLGTEDETDPRWDFLSLEKRVNSGTPPAFLWHCADDGLVPVENSFCYAQALRAHDIPFELHICPKGGHGLQMTTQRILCSRSMFPREYNWA